jgi:hypothetical protein
MVLGVLNVMLWSKNSEQSHRADEIRSFLDLIPPLKTYCSQCQQKSVCCLHR